MNTHRFFLVMFLVLCFVIPACGGGGGDDDDDDDDGPPPYGELTIDYVSPDEGLVGEDTWVSIEGMGFEGRHLQVLFSGNIDLPDVEAVTPDAIRFRVPRDWLENNAGVHDVWVVRDDGVKAIFPNGFELKVPPADDPPPDENELTIETVTPNQGYNDGPTTVSIRGTGFFGSMRFLIGELAELDELNVKSATRATAVVPEGLEPGTYPVIAIRDGSVEFPLDYAFEVMERPVGDDDDECVGWCVNILDSANNGGYTAFTLNPLVYVNWLDWVAPNHFHGGTWWDEVDDALRWNPADVGSDECPADENWVRFERIELPGGGTMGRICTNMQIEAMKFARFDPWGGETAFYTTYQIP